MTTIKERLIKMLVSNGMFESQAIEVMDIAIPKMAKQLETEINFNEDESSYPDVMYNIFFAAIRPIALEWINEHKPMAWFKPMFEQD